MRRSSNRAPSRGAGKARSAALLTLLAWLALVPISAAAPASDGATAGVEESWYVLELGGRPAGWALERRSHEGGRVVTEERLTLRLARGASDLEVSLSGRFEETDDGEPLLLRTRQTLGSEPVETTYRFLDGGREGIEAKSVQAGRERSEVLPAPAGEWLTPEAARRAVVAHHAAGDLRYEYRAIEPLEGPEPVTTTRTRIEPDGDPERWREETSSAPGSPAVVELDAGGEVVRSEAELFGLRMVAYRTDRETALAAVSPAPGESGPEVMVGTLVHPDRPIPEHRSATRAVYELSLEDGSPMPDLPGSGAQRVAPAGELGDRVRVTVYRDPGAAPPDDDRTGDGVTDGNLVPSLYLDYRDPDVRRLLESVRPSDADPGPSRATPAELAATARELTRFVHRYVGRKDLDTGFATASEVARGRGGDCTEHAVLLAALLRAEGIPSRVVTGLVYLDDYLGAEAVFGYHMWVQAALPFAGAEDSDAADPFGAGRSRWIDLDPTLPWGFDATHIALGHSDLAGSGRDPSLDRLLPLVGRLRIAVVEVIESGDLSAWIDEPGG